MLFPLLLLLASYVLDYLLGPVCPRSDLAIFGAILGGISNFFTNEKNYQLGKRTNELNYKMHQEDINTQWNMWHAQNRYNTPAQQVARLRAAGLNPQLVMSDGSIGQAGSMSVPSGAPMQQPTPMQTYDWGSQLTQAIQTALASKMDAASIRKTNAEAANIEIGNEFARDMRRAELRKIIGDESYTKSQRKLAEHELHWREVSDDVRLSGMQKENELADANVDLAIAHADYARWQKISGDLHDKLDIKADKRAERQLNALLEQIHEQVKEIKARTGLTNEQKETEIKRRSGVILDNVGKVFDNGQKAIIFQYLEPKIAAEIENTESNTLKNLFDTESFKVGPFEFKGHPYDSYPFHWLEDYIGSPDSSASRNYKKSRWR